MRDAFSKRLQEELAARRRSAVVRLPPKPERDPLAAMSAHSEKSLRHLTRGLQAASAKIAVEKSKRDATAIRDRLALHLESALLGQEGATAFDLKINPGSSVYAPPYDFEWNIGVAVAFGAKSDGNFFVLQPEPGQESAAGIGILLQSPTLLDVALTPLGSYRSSIFSVEDQPANSWSTGGVAVTVYKGSDQTPEISRLITLWSAASPRQWFGLS